MLFSIIVLSYNRPKEIERIIKNLLTAAPSNFNLIIKDDCSPRQKEIEEVINLYKKQSKYEIIFHKNKENLGYDKNLLDAFNISNAEYIFLLSDDDFLNGKYISELSEILSKRNFKFYFTPYTYEKSVFRKNIRLFNLNNFQEVIYNSILFSGLIFNREAVLLLNKDEQFLSTCIYTQVYLASVLVFNEKSFGEAPEKLLHLGGDGENFFGKNESAVNKELLRERSTAVANLRYQVFLLRVVEKISKSTSSVILTIFMREYKIRLIGYLIKTRAIGLSSYLALVKELKLQNIDLCWLIKSLIVIIFFLPSQICIFCYKGAVALFRRAG
jgi:glycosyltransferase involved in cell wall biosynthesis